jgi:hypothetical protein
LTNQVDVVYIEIFNSPSLIMALKYKVSHSEGEFLTGKLWRKDHAGFRQLPFFSNIPRMDEMAEPLEKALLEVGGDGCCDASLVVSFFSNRP